MTVKWYGNQVAQAVHSGEERALVRCGLILERHIKLSMKEGTGKLYPRGKGKGKKYHQASEPGRPPASDSGRLRASITYAVSNGKKSEPKGKGARPDDGVGVPPAKRDEVICIVGSNVEYAPHMEIGTHRIAPRPFARVALEQKKDILLKELARGGIRKR